MQYYREDDLVIIKVGPLRPWDNNAYIIADTGAREALLVDMPADSDDGDESSGSAANGTHVLAALGDLALNGAKVGQVVATHWHGDHWMSYDAIRAATGAPVSVFAHEINVPPERIDRKVEEDDELRCGKARLRVIHTPGHTPGSICLRMGRYLLSGDTLFNGGPGRTQAPKDLLTEIAAIVAKLHVLPDDVQVLPGHGADTLMADSRREYAVFAAKQHAPDLCGDVEWLKS